jgi:hypothetical protein
MCARPPETAPSPLYVPTTVLRRILALVVLRRCKINWYETSRRCTPKPRVQAAERTGDARAGRQDGRGRRPVGWGRGGRREEGREVARRSANASERKAREYEAVHFVSNRFQTVWGRKRAMLKLEFGSRLREFGPNYGPSFHATPNVRIRV